MIVTLVYCTCPIVGLVAYNYFKSSMSPLYSFLLAIFLAYIPTYSITGHLSKHGGWKWRWLQTHPRNSFLKRLLGASINLEEKLDNEKQYIFCNFPHGTCSVNHMLTMTDCCEMLTKHHTGDRRDLAASVLFLIPVIKEILLFLGCVDASSYTCHYNLKRGRSILIFIGGEKEQLMTEPGNHKIYLRSRKGFVKLALQYGCDLIPMYAFGENEVYHTSRFAEGFRSWLQHNFKLGIPIFFGYWGVPFGLVPKKVEIGLEIGKPIKVTKFEKGKITNKDIDALHETFMKEMIRLFDRTKAKHGVDAKTKLEIL